MISRRFNFIGSVRAIDTASERCNFRKFPLPVSRSHAPVQVCRTTLFLVAVACIAAGIAIGVVVSAQLALG